ncbi:hypothetical protein PGT21_006605 [Puccinia graminis f. sp. tritici]|uniref:Uncharacterized protein n=1 Tax=Puccinia graminis f. sp. tritici TaxID=56615 RepID=A0A5B0P590_PUCGR|nr:hypothetical protein PGT21_006605 [Puccinia graminis f. sp. tritici]KAA1104918.1 hypothetical protein PGTUg99_011144 [Puccinia graminis f. sp. tritici]
MKLQKMVQSLQSIIPLCTSCPPSSTCVPPKLSWVGLGASSGRQCQWHWQSNHISGLMSEAWNEYCNIHQSVKFEPYIVDCEHLFTHHPNTENVYLFCFHSLSEKGLTDQLLKKSGSGFRMLQYV